MYIVTASPIAILAQEICFPTSVSIQTLGIMLDIICTIDFARPQLRRALGNTCRAFTEYYRQYCSGLMLRMGQLFLRTLVNRRQRKASMLAPLQRAKTSYSKLRPYRHLGSSFQVGLNNRPPITFHRVDYGLRGGNGGDS